MFKKLAGEFAEITEQLLETLWAWKSETEIASKERLWQQLVVWHEMHKSGFERLSEHMETETEDARILSAATLKRHAVWRGDKNLK